MTRIVRLVAFAIDLARNPCLIYGLALAFAEQISIEAHREKQQGRA